jgi:hypothetical protein
VSRGRDDLSCAVAPARRVSRPDHPASGSGVRLDGRARQPCTPRIGCASLGGERGALLAHTDKSAARHVRNDTAVAAFLIGPTLSIHTSATNTRSPGRLIMASKTTCDWKRKQTLLSVPRHPDRFR